MKTDKKVLESFLCDRNGQSHLCPVVFVGSMKRACDWWFWTVLFVAVFNTHWVSQPNLLHHFFALDSSLFDAAVHMFLFRVGMGLEAADCLTISFK